MAETVSVPMNDVRCAAPLVVASWMPDMPRAEKSWPNHGSRLMSDPVSSKNRVSSRWYSWAVVAEVIGFQTSAEIWVSR